MRGTHDRVVEPRRQGRSYTQGIARYFLIQRHQRAKNTVGLSLHELRQGRENHLEICARGDQIENTILVGENSRLVAAIRLAPEAFQCEGCFHRQLLHQVDDVLLEKLFLLRKNAQHSDDLVLASQRKRRQRAKHAAGRPYVVEYVRSRIAQRETHHLEVSGSIC